LKDSKPLINPQSEIRIPQFIHPPATAGGTDQAAVLQRSHSIANRNNDRALKERQTMCHVFNAGYRPNLTGRDTTNQASKLANESRAISAPVE